jgi:ligand-binding sensor domain-containing protein/two-component sensor histidine kinase
MSPFVNKACRYILPVIALFTFFRLSSQTYHFTAISVEHGLSQSQVNCIMEDSRGFLWIGTAGGGINEYDGNTFKVYDEKDGLAGNIVNTIEEDHNGNIWVGSTWGGLSIFDGKKFRVLTKDDGLRESGGVISICRAKNNQMLVAFDHGIDILEGKSISEFHSEIFANHKIYKLFRDKSGNIWILTDKSLFIYNGYSLVDLNSAFDIHFPFSSIAQDKNGNIWLGSYGNGLYILSKAHNDKYILTPYTKNEQLNQISAQSILIDKENNLWLGTNDFGIVKYDYKTITFINQANGFPNNNILAFCEDHYGNIWFGTNGSGLIKYFPCPFSYFDNIEGFKRADVFSILCDKDGAVWAASQSLGLYRLYNNELECFDETKGILSRSIRALAQDKNGKIWIGTKNGLNYIDKGKVYKLDLPTTKKYVRTLLCDAQNNLWISVYGEGLLKFDGSSFRLYTQKDGLNHDFIHSLFQDKKGNIWIGTGNGINRMKDGLIEDFVLGTNLCNKYIGSITEDSFGNVWFGTDRCLIRYNGQEFSSFNISDALTSNTIYLLTSDKKGRVYVGTNKGIDKMTIQPNGDILEIKNYGISEGFKGLECNSRCVSVDTAGNIFFGTIKGVIKYLPANDKAEDHRTSIHLTNIRLFPYDKTDWAGYSDNLTNWFKLPTDLVLPYSENNISFDFTGINLFHPEKVKYRVFLEGFDGDWIDNTTKNATYTNLPAGRYTMKVMAYTDDINKASYTQFAFEIRQAFWKTWWFIILMLFLLAASVYIFMKFRTRRIQLSNEKLESLIELRTREITKQKLEIETLYKEVHHRVKNNLQVINSIINLQSSYITDENTLAIFKECQNRVYTMAVLHEKLYSAKDLTNNKLGPYIERIVEYLAYVYKNNLEIKTEIDINVSQIGLDTTIPIGLLINEIVSNSFKYAFDESIKNKTILIRIEQIEPKKYRMLAGDNGKGFEERKDEGTVSFGLELINILVDQLNGTIRKLPEQGTLYEVIFFNIDKDITKTP